MIGERIQRVRIKERMTQGEFAYCLGVTPSYVSKLEANKAAPSEQLILSICSIFAISYDWLKEEKGVIYKDLKWSPTSVDLINEIIRRIQSMEVIVDLNPIAYILGVDIFNLKKAVPVSHDFWDALENLIKIFKEGNKKKIDLITRMVKLLVEAVILPEEEGPFPRPHKHKKSKRKELKDDRQNLLGDEKEKYVFEPSKSPIEAPKKAEDE
jgi:transcriptional regulator with XRE-family HTH domain